MYTCDITTRIGEGFYNFMNHAFYKKKMYQLVELTYQMTYELKGCIEYNWTNTKITIKQMIKGQSIRFRYLLPGIC